ncbi:MAG: IS4 family transposase [Solirubrobacterales bacterium]|nr:IS4 family transposase [Solirubrobacterales bacterium]
MPRAGQRKPPFDSRLTDHVSIGVLTRVFPPELVDGVVAQAGRGERRHRLLPARVVVYYVLALALFADCSYEEVMRQLVEGLAWESGWRQVWEVPQKGSIAKARARLGVEPLRLLFRAVAEPLATEGTRGAFYRGLRLVSLDGTCLDVADTAENEEAFGRPGCAQGQGAGAFPQLRLVALAESGTHAIFDAALGSCELSEVALADWLWGSLEEGMLCVADRGFWSFARFHKARGTGAQLLWRAKTNLFVARERELADGSYLSTLYPSQKAQHERRGGAPARVIEYSIDEPALATEDQRYRLITTILDPDQAPARELAALYPQRWELESALDELKTHQRGPRVVLRSKHPDGVYQEAFGHLCTHYAIRRVMHDAALSADLIPHRLSFTRSLRAARRATRTQPGFSPPQP